MSNSRAAPSEYLHIKTHLFCKKHVFLSSYTGHMQQHTHTATSSTRFNTSICWVYTSCGAYLWVGGWGIILVRLTHLTFGAQFMYLCYHTSPHPCIRLIRRRSEMAASSSLVASVAPTVSVVRSLDTLLKTAMLSCADPFCNKSDNVFDRFGTHNEFSDPEMKLICDHHYELQHNFELYVVQLFNCIPHVSWIGAYRISCQRDHRSSSITIS
jgi:hypothetical protein